MADVDEDVVRSSHGTNEAVEEEDDETQDYRFLSNLSALTNQSSNVTLPARGIKDFEPHATDLQAATLDASRNAMHDALSHLRTHMPRNHVYGVYDSRTGMTTIEKVKGSLFRTVGSDMSGGGVQLLPEEALWALERGSLDIYWGSELVESEDETLDAKHEDATEREQAETNEDIGLPMSLQGAYAAFLGGEEQRDGWLTLEKYLVYAGLKRSGYIVTRAACNKFTAERFQSNLATSANAPKETWSLFSWLYQLVARAEPTLLSSRRPLGPLVTPGLYRSYNDIYRRLQLTFTSKPETSDTPPNSSTHVSPVDDNGALPVTESPYKTTFNVYKPTPSFRKSNPGPPNFRVCVVSARETSIPTLSELDSLLSEQPHDPPSSRPGDGGLGGMYGRLKHGHRNVLLAVVDAGIVSYFRVSDAAFAKERLWQKPNAAIRKGGRGKHRGAKTGARGSGRGK